MRVLCAFTLLSVVVANSPCGLTDQCGCGVHGCDHLRQIADCNSYAHLQLLHSDCSAAPDKCPDGAQSSLPTGVLKVAQCEMAISPHVAVSMAHSVFAFFALFPVFSSGLAYSMSDP